jgi:hypothetical protein
MESAVAFLQEHGAMLAVLAAILLPLGYVFRKFTVPFLFHTAEFAIYVSVFHVVLHGLVRMFSWFRAETEFRNFDGSLRDDFNPIQTPLFHQFWNRELYSPEWLFYVELAAVGVMLYLVIVVRPTRFAQPKNKYGGNPKRGFEKGSKLERPRSMASRSR